MRILERNLLLLIIVVITILATSLNIYYNNRFKRMKSIDLDKSINQLNRVEVFTDIYTSLFLCIRDTLPITDTLYNIRKGKYERITDLAYFDKKLILFYSFKDCPACIDSTIVILKGSGIKTNNMLLISKQTNLGEYSRQLRSLEVKCDVFVLKPQQWDSLDIAQITPCLFFIDHDGIISSLLPIRSKYSDIIPGYLSLVNKEFNYNRLTE